MGRGSSWDLVGYLEIIREGARERFAIRKSREGASAFRDKNLLALAGRTKSRLFKSSTQQATLPADQDFIALDSSRKRKRADDEDTGSSSGSRRPVVPVYRGKAKPNRDSDSAFESDSDDSGAEWQYTTPATSRSIELGRIVKDRPDDVQAWLELIGLQDELFAENEESGHVRTRDEMKALASIKVSMFETALPHAVSPEGREKLLRGSDAGRLLRLESPKY